MRMPAAHAPGAVAARNPAGDGVVPPLTFRLPAGFRPLPLSAAPAERAAAVRDLAGEMYPAAGEQARSAAAAGYELMTAVLDASGVEFAAFGLFGTPDGGVAHGSLTIAALPSAHACAEAAALGLRETFLRDPVRDTRWLDLPCGPAVAVVSLRAAALPGAAAELTTGQIQVHIPFPDDPWIAVFTFETSALEQWDQMCVLMADLLKTVRFAGEPAAAAGPAVTGLPATAGTR